MCKPTLKFCLALAAMLFAAMPNRSEADGKIRIIALPSNQTPMKDEMITVPIIVDMAETDFRLGCIAARLQWDAAKLAFVDFAPGATEGFTEPVANINKIAEGKLIFASINATGAISQVNVLTLRLQATADITQWQGLQLEVVTLAAAENFTDLAPLVERVITGVRISDEGAELPKTFALHQNAPNPFNPETVIRYELPKAGKVFLTIYNLNGQRVRTLKDGEQPAGRHSALWNGSDDRDQQVASGTYFCRIEVRARNGEEFIATRKLSILR